MSRRRISNRTPRELTPAERKVVSDVVLERDSDFRVKTGSVNFVGDYTPVPGVMVLSEHDGKMYYADINGWNEMNVPLPTYRYNGIDNYHYNDEADFLIAESSGSIKARFYFSGVDSVIIFASSDTGTNYYNVNIQISGFTGEMIWQFTNTTEQDSRIFMRTVSTISAGWHIMEIVSDGSSYVLTVDGVEMEIAIVSGEVLGMWFGDVENRDNISIGALIDDGPNFNKGAVQWVQIDDGANGDWHYDAATNSFIDRSVHGLDLAPVGTWP